MTLIQRLRGLLTTDPHIAALSASGIIYQQSTVAEQMCEEWEGSTVRDPLFRETATRIATRVNHAAVSCIWRFGDGSGLVANYKGVFVLCQTKSLTQ